VVTPLLVALMGRLQEEGVHDVQVVYVSGDHDAEEFAGACVAPTAQGGVPSLCPF
jgi:hypothetical protein